MQNNKQSPARGLGRLGQIATTLFLCAGLLGAAMTASAQAEPRTIDGEGPCACTAEYMLSTGAANGYTPDAIAALDQHWTLVSGPSLGPGPVASITPHPNWANTGGANWINPWSQAPPSSGFPNYGNNWASAPSGLYVYEIQFALDFNVHTNFVFSMDFASDNRAGVILNGMFLGSTGATFSFTTFTSTNLAQQNTLRVEVNNWQGYTGFIAAGGVTGDCIWSETEDLSFDVSTGTDGAALQGMGALDPDWVVVSSPDGFGPGAFSIYPLEYWVNSTEANWINPYGNMAGNGVFVPGNNRYDAPAGAYTYELSFYLPPASIDMQLSFNFSADNGVDFYLNGFPIGGEPAPAAALAWHHIAVNDQSKFQPGGVNVLRAVVDNDGDWTGLIVEGSAGAACDPCHHEHDDGPLGGRDPTVYTGGGPIQPADPERLFRDLDQFTHENTAVIFGAL